MSIKPTSFLPKFNNNIANTIKPKALKVPVKLVFTPAELGIDQRKAPKTVKLTDQQIEKKLFESFGLNIDDAKKRLKTDNPFAKVETTGDNTFNYNGKTGKYEATLNVEKVLHKELSGKASELKKQIADEKKTAEPKSPSNPNDAIAGKNGVNEAQNQRARFDKLLKDAQILPTGIGPESKLTDLKHISVTLPDGVEPTADNALSTYIERQYGKGNLFGQDKIDILNLAKERGVKVENLKIDGKNASFDMSVENLLKLHHTYIGVQAKVNADIAVFDNVKDKAALNQFLKGTMEGAWESLKSNWNTITHPIETVKGVIEAVKTLASLSKDDLANLAKQLTESGKDLVFKDDVSEVANKAGKVVGALAVEIALGKGVGVALKAVKGIPAIASLVTKAEELSKIAKLKVVAEFSDEAAALASQRIKQALRNPVLYNGIAGAELLKDYAVVAANRISNGAVKFADFSRKLVDEFGDRVKPYVEKLYREQMIELGLGKEIDEIGIKGINLSKVKQIPDAILDPPKGIRNIDLAGKKHPVTGVYFDRNGYPVFDSKFDAQLPKNLQGNSVSDYEQFKESTKQLKREILAKPSAGNVFTKDQLVDIMAEKDKIRGLTWHHHQDGVRLQLVSRDIHRKTGHDGGRKNTGGRPK
jgi:hypothetical protein